MLVGLVLGVYLIGQQTHLFSRAGLDASNITIFGSSVSGDKTSSPNVKVRVHIAVAPVSIGKVVFPDRFRLANSKDSLAIAKPQPFAQNDTELDWVLTPGDGPKTVYGQVLLNGQWQDV